MRRLCFWLLLLLLAACVRLRPAPVVTAPSTPEAIERGRYLVENVTACLYCHSEHDWSKYAGPTKPGTLGGGGVCTHQEHGMRGEVCTQNLTPHEKGLKGWTDGEILRAMREGVSKDGRALFPTMPYSYYRALSDDDALAIVAYLRQLKPVDNLPNRTWLKFPTSQFIKFIPAPLEGPVAPPVDRGEYLVKISACDYCHTNQPRGDREVGKDFAGGFFLRGPWGEVVTPNITPHPTGMGRMTREQFIGRVKAWQDIDLFEAERVGTGASVMPWKYYSGMTEEDLGLIYDWIFKNVKPVERTVDVFGLGQLDGGVRVFP